MVYLGPSQACLTCKRRRKKVSVWFRFSQERPSKYANLLSLLYIVRRNSACTYYLAVRLLPSPAPLPSFISHLCVPIQSVPNTDVSRLLVVHAMSQRTTHMWGIRGRAKLCNPEIHVPRRRATDVSNHGPKVQSPRARLHARDGLVSG